MEGNAENYGLEAHICYFSIVKNNVIPSDIHLYHAAVDSISIAASPTKISYEYGELLTTAGLKLNVNYVAGAPREVDSGFTVDKTEPLTEEDTVITVTYEGKTATFEITVAPAPETGLQMILLENAPTELLYVDGGTQTVAEALAAAGMTVTAQYADKEPATVTDYEVINGDAVIDGNLTSYTVSYTENGVTRIKEVPVTTSLSTPAQIAENSTADLVFYTYFTKDSNVVNGVLELNYAAESTTTGTFVYTVQMGSAKYNTLKGSFTIAEGKISFTEITMKQVLGNSAMTTDADESANVVTDDGGKIIGLDFGCLAGNVDGVTQEGFWGYTANKQSSCKSSAAETVGKPAYMIYMVRIENGDISTLRVDY